MPINPTLDSFTFAHDDDAYSDPPMTHTWCGEVVCTVETGDTLDLLIRVAEDHANSCTADDPDAPSSRRPPNEALANRQTFR